MTLSGPIAFVCLALLKRRGCGSWTKLVFHPTLSSFFTTRTGATGLAQRTVQGRHPPPLLTCQSNNGHALTILPSAYASGLERTISYMQGTISTLGQTSFFSGVQESRLRLPGFRRNSVVPVLHICSRWSAPSSRSGLTRSPPLDGTWTSRLKGTKRRQVSPIDSSLVSHCLQSSCHFAGV